MKAVLISIKPKWVDLIASGNKTVEVRKTKPNIETPFRVYIYQTKAKIDFERGDLSSYEFLSYREGKVIGEFVCDKIYAINTCNEADRSRIGYCATVDDEVFEEMTCLSIYEIGEYLKDNDGYGWHISKLKIYDEPKDLSEFCTMCTRIKKDYCRHCEYLKQDSWDEPPYCEVDGILSVVRPPQSWCYIEETYEII